MEEYDFREDYNIEKFEFSEGQIVGPEVCLELLLSSRKVKDSFYPPLKDYMLRNYIARGDIRPVLKMPNGRIYFTMREVERLKRTLSHRARGVHFEFDKEKIKEVLNEREAESERD